MPDLPEISKTCFLCEHGEQYKENWMVCHNKDSDHSEHVLTPGHQCEQWTLAKRIAK